ncbi:MAG: hypothetical protein P4N59_17715 [Negativicutes bacterium]|nr:hypothetical protein [Negativicutes bacterium]
MDNTQSNAPRFPKSYMCTVQTCSIHLRNPLVIALWSAAFPGFGHLILGNFIKGFLLVLWEIVVNTQSHLNVLILHTFTGRFTEALAVINPRWLMFYIPVYLFTIWDSYRSAVDLNKLAVLAERSPQQVTPVRISCLEVSYLEKRIPWVALIWSMFMPGAGNLYVQRLPTGVFLILWWVTIAYQSHFLEAIIYTCLGDFSQAMAITDPEWLLFLPSVHYFAMYSSYVTAVEGNQLFDSDQAAHLVKTYPYAPGKMPL